jgi:hypothetical protein
LKARTPATTAPAAETSASSPRRLDPVDQQTGEAGDEDRGPEEADPQRRDQPAGIGLLTDEQPQRDDRHPVAGGREADRAGDQAEVAVAEEAELHPPT